VYFKQNSITCLK